MGIRVRAQICLRCRFPCRVLAHVGRAPPDSDATWEVVSSDSPEKVCATVDPTSIPCMDPAGSIVASKLPSPAPPDHKQSNHLCRWGDPYLPQMIHPRKYRERPRSTVGSRVFRGCRRVALANRRPTIGDSPSLQVPPSRPNCEALQRRLRSRLAAKARPPGKKESLNYWPFWSR